MATNGSRPTLAGLMAYLAICLAAETSHAQVVEWIRQLGTSSWDYSSGASADGLGNVYIAGTTEGALDGTNAGGRDAFVSKYDGAGALVWTRQLGTSSGDEINGVSSDGLGNVYISGSTAGAFDGPNVGNSDAFVSKYDAAGALLWTRQLGTRTFDFGYGVSADGLGNVYISGATFGALEGPGAGNVDAFVSKYDAAGALLWTRQLGTGFGSYSYGVSADGLGNVYLSGGALVGSNAGSSDAFVCKYDTTGALVWTRQLGTDSLDEGLGVSADGFGDVYISGYTRGALDGPNAGRHDAFVSKYDALGALVWTRQLGTSSEDYSRGVSADRLGNVYISGSTEGALSGPSAGGHDAFVSKYDGFGALLWTHQLGASPGVFDISRGVSADGLGNVYISGGTDGALGGPNAGNFDAFLVKIAVPEPASGTFISIVGLALIAIHRRTSTLLDRHELS